MTPRYYNTSPGRSRPLVWIAAACLSLAVAGVVIPLAYARQRRQSATSAIADPQRVRAALESAAAYLGSTELRGDDTWTTRPGRCR